MLQKALDVATEVEAEPMHHIDFQDLEHCPRKVTKSASTVAVNAAHVARLLRDAP